MKRQNDPMLVSFKYLDKESRWEACMNALNHEYTTSFRDVCKMLKCDRSWVTKYIRPHIHYIYLSNGYSRNSPPFTKIASTYLHKEINDSIWFNTKELHSLIYSNFSKCTRQTINIPLDWLISHDKLDTFRADYKYYTEQMNNIQYNQLRLYNKYKQKRDELIAENISYIGSCMMAFLPDKYNRGECPAVETKLPDFNINDIISVSDIMEYGDTSEMVYRNLFVDGCYKLQLSLKDLNGTLSNKIYYLKIKDLNLSNCIDTILVRYIDYERCFDENAVKLVTYEDLINNFPKLYN